jgi:hypothetical protein
MMIKIKRIMSILLTLIFLSSITSLYAQRSDSGIDPPEFERIGQSGWQFLHLPTVARNAALAGVKTGLSHNSVTAIFTNPAKLTDVSNIDASFSNISYVADINYLTAAVAMNFGNLGVFGLHVANLDAGDMIRTENIYDEDLDLTSRSGDLETFTAGDIKVGISYAKLITANLSVGGNFSYLQEKLDDTKVENFTVDLGLFFKTGFRSLTLSMVASNLGPDQEFTGFTEIYGLPQSVRMPVNYRLGLTYDIIEPTTDGTHELTSFLEGVHPNDGPERVNAALEYNFISIFYLRGGYMFNYDEQGFTAGAGINYNMSGVTGRIDYAYLDYGRLDAVHLFTLGFAIEE